MRFVSFNIHHAEGLDGRVSLRRIAGVIRAASPDAACIQEVWRGRLLGNQPAVLESLLGMRGAFQDNVRRPRRDFGNLVLTRGRLLGVERLSLSSALEPRGCLLARVELGSVRFALATTHLGLDRDERAEHLRILAEWLPAAEPLVLMGDFNAADEELAPIRTRFTIAEPSPATFPAGRPRAAIDRVAYSEHWRLDSLSTIPTAASDHLPLVAELTLA